MSKDSFLAQMLNFLLGRGNHSTTQEGAGQSSGHSNGSATDSGSKSEKKAGKGKEDSRVKDAKGGASQGTKSDANDPKHRSRQYNRNVPNSTEGEGPQYTSGETRFSGTSTAQFTKPHSASSYTYVDEKSLFTPANVMRALGVEILEDGGEGYYLVGFQGGAFVFYFDDNKLNVMYNDVVECSFTDSVKAAFVANDINGEYAVWSCYMRASKRGSTEKPIKVCFSQMFSLAGNFKETTEFIHGVLSSAFTVGREFKERYKQALNDDSNLANTLNKRDFMNKLELTKRLIEVGNFDEYGDEMPPSNYLCVDSLAGLFDDTQFGEPLSLQVLSDGVLDKIEGPSDVENFDLRSYIRNLPNREHVENVTVVAVFEKQNLILNLKKMPGSTNKTLFFMLNVLRSGIEADLFSRNQSAVSFRATVEIRLTSEQEDYWEVKYMIDEAKDKHSKNDISSLTEEQKMMLIQIAPNVQDDFYWGIKYFNEDCWYQSLYYFKRIYYNYCRQDATHKRNQEMVADISLYLGITYYHLKMYDRAYYYLDRSRKYDSILASEWYVNCLVSMKDPMAFQYVKKMLENVALDLEETNGHLRKETEDEFYKYYLFLKRKIVQIMIADYRFRDAEDLLRRMIENNENVDFSKHELDNLRKIRKEQAEEAKRRQEELQQHLHQHKDAPKTVEVDSKQSDTDSSSATGDLCETGKDSEGMNGSAADSKETDEAADNSENDSEDKDNQKEI